MAILSFPRLHIVDTLRNLVSGLGTSKDKSTHTTYVLNLLTQVDLECAYRGDWIARKIVDAPAQDCTRMWRAWQAENDQIEDIENLEKHHQIQLKVERALRVARLYGGAGIVLGVRGAGKADEELILERVTADSLVFAHVVPKHRLTSTGQVIDDMTSPYYGEPEYYELQPGGGSMGPVRIHPSRVVRVIGSELPDPQITGEQWWGESVLQSVDEAVRSAGMVQGGIAALVHEAKIDVINIPDLTEHLSTQAYADKLTERFTYANTIKSVINTLVLDEKETWQRHNVSFGSLPDVFKMYLLVASGAADIPATRLLGQSPAGLSATGESDVRNYYDRLKSEQEMRLTPALNRLDEVLVRSALGDYPEDLYYEWNSLWQMTDLERADLATKKASVYKLDVDVGLLPLEALREGRENQLIEDGTYPGIEAALAEYADVDSPLLEMREAQLLAMQEGGEDENEDEEGGPPGKKGAPFGKKAGKSAGNDNVAAARAALLVDRDYDDDEHPRHGAGAPGGKGGQFAAKGEAEKGGDEDDKEEKEESAGSEKDESDKEESTGEPKKPGEGEGKKKDDESEGDDKKKGGAEGLEGFGGFGGVGGKKKEEERGRHAETTSTESEPDEDAGDPKRDEPRRKPAKKKPEQKKGVKPPGGKKGGGRSGGAAGGGAKGGGGASGGGNPQAPRVGEAAKPPTQAQASQMSERVTTMSSGEIDRFAEKYGLDVGEDASLAEKRRRLLRRLSLRDAAPRTLYVCRPLLNAGALRAWAREQGFASVLRDPHVTVCHSRQPVDWMLIDRDWNEDEEGCVTVRPGGARLVERLGDNGAAVLMFSSGIISHRHQQIVNAGASHDYPEYQPHVTVSYRAEGVDLRKVEPYRGPLLFGPEEFREVNEGFTPPDEEKLR